MGIRRLRPTTRKYPTFPAMSGAWSYGNFPEGQWPTWDRWKGWKGVQNMNEICFFNRFRIWNSYFMETRFFFEQTAGEGKRTHPCQAVVPMWCRRGHHHFEWSPDQWFVLLSWWIWLDMIGIYWDILGCWMNSYSQSWSTLNQEKLAAGSSAKILQFQRVAGGTWRQPNLSARLGRLKSQSRLVPWTKGLADSGKLA